MRDKVDTNNAVKNISFPKRNREKSSFSYLLVKNGDNCGKSIANAEAQGKKIIPNSRTRFITGFMANGAWAGTA